MNRFNPDDYEDVQSRLTRWYGDHPNARTSTRIEHFFTDDSGAITSVVVSAGVYRDQADEHPAGTGLAQEHRSDRGVNLAFALENCETSALGRALVNAGQTPLDGRRPSREEMQKAAAVAAHKTTRPGLSGPAAGDVSAGGEGPPSRSAKPVVPNPPADTPSMSDAIGNVLDAMPGSRIAGQGQTPATGAGATEKQQGMIRRLMRLLNLEGDLAREYVGHVLGGPVTFDALTKKQASDLITALKEDEAKQADPVNNPAVTDDPWAGEQGAF